MPAVPAFILTSNASNAILMTLPRTGPGATATFDAVGLGVGLDGSVYVADYGNHRIRKLTVKPTVV